ncbi:lysine--tRNA ligase [Candidatus Peregrinibacteria bacterium]|nr:lysine--tRNA ligase [Candidatus Peregrinibacteria bacterium]
MVWVDRILGELQERFAMQIGNGEPLILRDEKTLSGRVHVGSLRGIVIHGLIGQALSEEGIPNRFLFELNDFDPMDELPANLPNRDSFQKYMGQPLFTVPSSEASAKNYPMVFGEELERVVASLGFSIQFYPLEPLYRAGKFNGVIREALDHAAEIRAIYREVSGSEKPDDWYPLQVICEQCGKVGTTQVTGWDGTQVKYSCKKNLVKWAEGCGHEGTISPFDGRAKLPWKVEWPAKWKVMGVHIEGAGKDHSAAGGSREIGKRICEEIFHYPNPFDIPYEFFNIGGKKMSASKGLGASAKEVSDLLPPKLLKLLMIRKLPNQPIDFDPEGTTPRFLRSADAPSASRRRSSETQRFPSHGSGEEGTRRAHVLRQAMDQFICAVIVSFPHPEGPNGFFLLASSRAETDRSSQRFSKEARECRVGRTGNPCLAA